MHLKCPRYMLNEFKCTKYCYYFDIVVCIWPVSKECSYAPLRVKAGYWHPLNPLIPWQRFTHWKLWDVGELELLMGSWNDSMTAFHPLKSLGCRWTWTYMIGSWNDPLNALHPWNIVWRFSGGGVVYLMNHRATNHEVRDSNPCPGTNVLSQNIDLHFPLSIQFK